MEKSFFLTGFMIKGDLKIEMKPINTENIAVYGEPDPILQAFSGKA